MAKIKLPDEVREQFKAAGSKGGHATFERHGHEFFAKISAAGGQAAKEKARLAKEAAEAKEAGEQE